MDYSPANLAMCCQPYWWIFPFDTVGKLPESHCVSVLIYIYYRVSKNISYLKITLIFHLLLNCHWLDTLWYNYFVLVSSTWRLALSWFIWAPYKCSLLAYLIPSLSSWRLLNSWIVIHQADLNRLLCWTVLIKGFAKWLIMFRISTINYLRIGRQCLFCYIIWTVSKSNQSFNCALNMFIEL